ncbi:sensor histidine kinase [Paracoccus sp. (in: a-proteobacteria)]|uniref:sensor histidine kinase n=1 Tax=Paracoccus sp. TaxID=267 RepID=UPI0026E09544|nr:histidine kinase dimerization/phosphoacceptor domain -containing protein [Paracoccus sp. (in: a-proteobacteria)]MDO5647489.1 histidine kinase dimerization/phosphoacceptor domain -containing protein [Paracoccus sp. (in: a-proteobacteria)]
MLTGVSDRLDFTRKLGFRLGALLSVAILPIGLISLVQNLNLSREAERSAEIALLGRTASAASGERALLQSALGSADAMGPAVLRTRDDPATCSDLMAEFVERSATYVSAAFVSIEGYTNCSAASQQGQLIDLHASPAWNKFLKDPTTTVMSLDQGIISGRAVVQPLYENRELLGYTTVSLTHDLLRSTHAAYFGTDGARVITFNNLGEFLATESESRDYVDILPVGVDLLAVAQQGETTFRGTTENGEKRIFTVVSVVPGLVYALGSWSPAVVGLDALTVSRFGAILLPVALWAASLAVAYFAVFRLVLRHISVLRGQMRRFALGSRDAPPPVLRGAPTEITDMSQTFHNMARILIRDEEEMERAVSEKTVLLKEVHHRVKNNLQLIASIINMQSRLIDDPDAKRVLRSVQDRVAALATIYRNLYQAEQLDAVDAGRLIGDIVNQMVNATTRPGESLRVDTQIRPLTLLPDQAVPLTLLATESVTNALKYASPAPGETASWVRVSLTTPEPGVAVLSIANSVGDARSDAEGTGLGSQLIEAFAMQLDGTAQQNQTPGTYELELRFNIETVDPAPAPDPRQVVLTSAARPGAQH